MMLKHRLNMLGVALVYTGAILGAGFASGREIWQFFGVFGNLGFIGVAMVGGLFIFLGIVTAVIAIKLGTNDMGRVIVPGHNKILVQFVGYFMAIMLFTVLITMSAAGGAMFDQQLGLPRFLGGAVIIAMVIMTVIGGFDRVSHAFRFMMPFLIGIILLLCVLVLFKGDGLEAGDTTFEPSPLAPTWWLAAILYISYNILAVIPIVATAAVNAKSTKHAIWGAALGGIFLTLLALFILLVLRTDPDLSNTMEMPMLAFSTNFSGVVNVIYTGVLFFAIYASATGNYYGFTTKLKPTSNKNLKIILIAILGFGFGLMGFKNVIAYMFPLEGFAGIIIIVMLMLNFIRLSRQKETKKHRSLFTDFEGFDRFDYPAGIIRVTGGFGGETTLILGSEKTAILDCGMAYCGELTAENIKRALKDKTNSRGIPRTLDYILLSHTHYDHVGGVPHIKSQWPMAVVCASAYADYVLRRSSALKVIQRLGEEAEKTFGTGDLSKITVKGLAVDRILSDGEVLSLGEESIHVLETPGHTNCSTTYVLEPAGIMFTSESTGVLEGEGCIHGAVLKSYRDARASLEKCKAYDAKRLISPHYGMVPLYYIQEYWNIFEKQIDEELIFIHSMYEQNLSENDMIQRFVDKYWEEERAQEQPIEAFLLNAKNTIKAAKNS
jgi:uncharacterized membrane protein YkvI/glyoxylase-like metal-dependent hydrolase (beta-lactamase superfamily II)